MNNESSKFQAVQGIIISGRANSFAGFILEVQADMGFIVGEHVWLSRTFPFGEPVEQHPDDVAVDAFAAAMKAKLAEARTKGRGGWDNAEPGMQQRLSDMLRAHVEKGDPRDVANFAMFLHQRGESILPKPEQAVGDGVEDHVAEVAHLYSDNYGHHHRIKWVNHYDNAFPVGTKLYVRLRSAVATPAEATDIDGIVRAARAMQAQCDGVDRWQRLSADVRAQWIESVLPIAAALAAQPSAVGVPEGWKLVPLTPTVEMLYAARTAPVPAVLVDSLSARANLDNAAKWRAMLAASPEVDRG